MVVHPPSTTHRQLDDSTLRESGIAPGLLRVSVGLEDLDDLCDDFAQALAAVPGAASGPERPEAPAPTAASAAPAG
jgi:hypothetical protein